MNTVSSPTRPSTYPGVKPFLRRQTFEARLGYLILGWQKAWRRAGSSVKTRGGRERSEPCKATGCRGTPRGAQQHLTRRRPQLQPGLTRHRVAHPTSSHRIREITSYPTSNHKYFTFTVEATHLIKSSLDN